MYKMMKFTYIRRKQNGTFCQRVMIDNSSTIIPVDAHCVSLVEGTVELATFPLLKSYSARISSSGFFLAFFNVPVFASTTARSARPGAEREARRIGQD